MSESPRHLEGIAREIHEETGVEPPIDAFDLANLCGVETVPWGKPDGMLVMPGHPEIHVTAPTIFYPRKARPARAQGTCSHELGHFVSLRAGIDARDEEAADYLAGALMIPRGALLAHLHEYDWDLLRIHPLHPNASWQMLVIRCVQVGEASASIWDQGRCSRAYGADAAMLAEHRERVMRVLETGRAERGAIDAYPVFTPGFRRVVCVERTV